MASGVYNAAKADIVDGTIDLTSATSNAFRVVLVDDYTFDATHTTYADVSSDEVSGTGYSAGGEGLSSLSVSQTAGTASWDAGDTTWAGSTITADGAVIVYTDDGTTDSSDKLLCYIDFGADHSSSSGNFTIAWDSAGILTWS
jgi:hypothetical protein